MTTVFPRRLTVRSVATVFAAMLLCSCVSSPATDPSLKSAKAKIEGVYSLQEWHIGSEVVRPPRVDGRFVLVDGAVITIFHNRVQETNQLTVANYGVYSLDAARFSYRYDDASVLDETPTAVTVSHKPPWDGMRPFTLIDEGNAVRLRSDNGLQEFLFTADGVSYSEDGKLLRVWRRLTQKQ